LGDRTFVIVAILATKCNQVNLFLVASIALFALNGMNVWIGVKKPSCVPNLASNIIVILVFLAAGIWTLLKGFKNEKINHCADNCHGESETVVKDGEALKEPLLEGEKGTTAQKDCHKYASWKCYAAMVVFLAVAEFGDKTQIAAIKLAGFYNPWSIVIGGGLAIICGVLIAIVIGKIL